MVSCFRGYSCPDSSDEIGRHFIEWPDRSGLQSERRVRAPTLAGFAQLDPDFARQTDYPARGTVDTAGAMQRRDFGIGDVVLAQQFFKTRASGPIKLAVQ